MAWQSCFTQEEQGTTTMVCVPSRQSALRICAQTRPALQASAVRGFFNIPISFSLKMKMRQTKLEITLIFQHIASPCHKPHRQSSIGVPLRSTSRHKMWQTVFLKWQMKTSVNKDHPLSSEEVHWNSSH